MPRKPLFVAFFLVLATGLPLQTVFANDSIVFGPARYERGWGKPRTVTTEFAGPNGISDFRMEIRNGDLRGRHRVWSGTVILNGRKVVLPCELNHHAARVERAVSLESSNSLKVRLQGIPGSFITVTIVGTNRVPTVSLSASPDSMQAGGSSTLSWASSNAETCEIDQGVGPVPLEGSKGVTPLETTTYTITARNSAGASTANVTVTVLNQGLSVNDDHASTPEDTGVAVDVLANDSGMGLSVAGVTQGAHGLVSLSLQGVVAYVPESNFNGEDRFTYVVRDGLGATATGTVVVAVNPVNDPPLADSQSLSVDQDTGTPVLLSGSDPDGDLLSFVVAALPAHGSLNGNPPHLTYNPAAGYHGPDGFTFKASDGSLASEPATVSIMVNRVNRPPTAVGDAAATGEGKAVVVPVLANDGDPDGDVLHVTAFSQGSHGTVADAGNDSLVYTPAAEFTGEDRFTYTVSDGKGGSASGTVIIQVTPLTSISLKITSPLEGEFIAGPTVMVRGTMVNPAGHETGVTVGGVTAQVHGSEFVANHVPLQDGENLITATAMDSAGNTISASVRVLADREAGYIRLHAATYSGLPTLDTTLRVDSSFGITNPAFSCTGPEEAEISGGSVPEERRLRLPAEGIYQCTVAAEDSQGRPYADTIVINVLSRDAIDGLLRAKWDAMKQRLAGGATESALEYFSNRTRDRYRVIFNELSHRVPEIVARMEGIEMILCRDDGAEYRIHRTHIVNVQPVTITYSIFFARDENGLWKIDRF